jgi:hypothetical protein
MPDWLDHMPTEQEARQRRGLDQPATPVVTVQGPTSPAVESPPVVNVNVDDLPL